MNINNSEYIRHLCNAIKILMLSWRSWNIISGIMKVSKWKNTWKEKDEENGCLSWSV